MNLLSPAPIASDFIDWPSTLHTRDRVHDKRTVSHSRFDAVVDRWGSPCYLSSDIARRKRVQEIARIDETSRLVPRDRTAVRGWKTTLCEASQRGGLHVIAIGHGANQHHALLVGIPGLSLVGVLVRTEHGACKDIIAGFSKCHDLTAAEQRVLGELAAGYPPKRIAAWSNRSEATVRSQVRSILEKTSMGSTRELLRCLSALELLLASTGVETHFDGAMVDRSSP